MGPALHLLACFAVAWCARAEVELLPERPSPSVLGGGRRGVTFQVRNPAAQSVELDLRYRVFQASGATLAPLGETKPWKPLTVPAGQTALEAFEVELPAVRGETSFQIAWFDGDKKIGTTPIRAFPDGILKLLGPLVGDKPLGVVDPDGLFKFALESVETTPLKEAEDVTGTESVLILVAPMSAPSRPAGLGAALKKKAAGGGGVIWFQPPPRGQWDWVPPVYVLEEGAGHIVVAPASLAVDLAVSPRAQINLVRLAELAAGRKKLELPADAPK